MANLMRNQTVGQVDPSLTQHQAQSAIYVKKKTRKSGKWMMNSVNLK